MTCSIMNMKNPDLVLRRLVWVLQKRSTELKQYANDATRNLKQTVSMNILYQIKKYRCVNRACI